MVLGYTRDPTGTVPVVPVVPVSAERAPLLDKAFLGKAAWRYPTVIFKNLDTLRYCFYVQALFFCIVFLDHVKHLQIHATGARVPSRHQPNAATKNTCMLRTQ